jgi:uncharacterized peroxidase-related enzyme
LQEEGLSDSEQDMMIENLVTDHSDPRLDEAEKEMLHYVRKLTVNPANIDKQDVMDLKKQGFGDREIHDICNIAAYFAYVNRVSDGLGVDLEL